MREELDRRTYLATITAAGVAGVAGCAGDASGATGTLATQVSDQPGDIDDFEECVVTIVGYWVGTDDASETDEESETAETTDGSEMDNTTDGTETTDADDEEGREYYELDESAEADLVQLQGDESRLIDAEELETGEYTFLQLDTDGVDATLTDGSEADVNVPGDAPLKFNQSFEIREDTRTVFTADFTPVERGQTDSYLLQPVASETTVSYETVTETETESN